MKKLKQIYAVFLLVIFIFVSTGMTIFQSHCSCTGEDTVSIYVSPDNCSDKAHEKHSHDECESESCCSIDIDECQTCANHMEDCGCATPNVKYLKLKSKIIQQESRIHKIKQIDIVPLVATIFLIKNIDLQEYVGLTFYIDPPPKYTTVEFLNLICQRKIPHIA